MGGQRRDGQRQPGILRIAAGGRLNVFADVARDIGVLRLAFKHKAAPADAWGLVFRLDVKGHGNAVRLADRGRAIVQAGRETVGSVLVGPGGGMHILHRPAVNVLLGKDRADADTLAVEGQIAIARQSRQAVHHLGGGLRAD
ncbi:hypothetical protein D3C75_322030 [compost metagenome]